MLKTLQQIFQLESIPCVCLHDILMRLLAKLCLDASFMCFQQTWLCRACKGLMRAVQANAGSGSLCRPDAGTAS